MSTDNHFRELLSWTFFPQQASKDSVSNTELLSCQIYGSTGLLRTPTLSLISNSGTVKVQGNHSRFHSLKPQNVLPSLVTVPTTQPRSSRRARGCIQLWGGPLPQLAPSASPLLHHRDCSKEGTQTSKGQSYTLLPAPPKKIHPGINIDSQFGSI